MPMPIEIVGLGKTEVRFVWDDDDESLWPAYALRVQCTCALCQSEATGQRILDPASVPRDISVTEMRLVGNYGVNIHFSDGHSTGIYRFAKLRDTQPPLFAIPGPDTPADADADSTAEDAPADAADAAGPDDTPDSPASA